MSAQPKMILRPFFDTGWIDVGTGVVPEQGSTVIAWCSNDGMPCVAFLDLDEDIWYSQTDGIEIEYGTVTHWRHCLRPS